MALPRFQRIKPSKQIALILRKGRTIENSLFLVKYLKNNLTNCRGAVAVSRSVSKKAVVRNRIKRIILEVLRKTFSRCRQPFDVVVAVRSGSREKKFSEISRSLEEVLNKAILSK